MRTGPIPVHRVHCANCHRVPLTIDEATHIDGDNRAEVTFGMLATANGATPTWDGKRCWGVYCHGATLKGGQWTNPEWLDKSGKAGRCGACHWTLHPGGGEKCATCHPTTVAGDGSILPNGTHLDGVLDVPGGAKGGPR
jgi:predicted CxxxxCH...CXXCH cytochrome family protein